MRIGWLKNWWRDLWAEPSTIGNDESQLIKDTLTGSELEAGPIPREFIDRVSTRLLARHEQIVDEASEVAGQYQAIQPLRENP